MQLLLAIPLQYVPWHPIKHSLRPDSRGWRYHLFIVHSWVEELPCAAHERPPARTVGCAVHEAPGGTLTTRRAIQWHVEVTFCRCLYLLDIVQESQDLLPLHGGLAALGGLALDKDVLDGLDFQLPLLLIIAMPQLQPLLGDLAAWILKLSHIPR